MIEQKNKYVVGLDFSGNPSHADFDQFKSHIFQPAKELGIKITVHVSEIEDQHQDTEDVLNFGPSRVGHCCLCTEDQL